MYSRRFSTLPAIGVLTLIYFIAGKLGLKLAFLYASASPVWPPAGIALAALLLLGYRVWPAIFLGAFLVNVTTAGNIATSLAIAAGNTLEGVCGAWLVNRFAGGTRAFDRAHDVFEFALIVAFACLISPTLGATSLAINGFANWTNYSVIWATWWLGDLSGALILAPLLILWGINPRRRLDPSRDLEVGILLVLIVSLSEIVFGGWLSISALNYPIAFILGPVIVWTAFRLSQRETVTGIFLISVIAIWGTLHGSGPFVRSSANQSLLTLESFNVLMTITAMALAAAMAERRRAEAAIEHRRAGHAGDGRGAIGRVKSFTRDDPPQCRVGKPAHRRSTRSHADRERQIGIEI